MSPSLRTTTLALASVALFLLCTSDTAQTAPAPQAIDDDAAQRRAVTDLRNVGTAMFSWLVDQVNDEQSVATLDPEHDTACVSRQDEHRPCDLVDLNALPLLTYAELTRLLVPTYIASIPEKDPWGTPYEFRVDRAHFLNKSVLAIRSAGADRTFSGSRYTTGELAPSEAAQDLVWADGYFIRWPAPPGR